VLLALSPWLRVDQTVTRFPQASEMRMTQPSATNVGHMSGTEPFSRFLQTKPRLKPDQAQARPGPQLRAWLVFWQARAHSSPAQAGPGTSLLIHYVVKPNVIPETQVATQQGVQTRNVMSYLSNVKCYAEHHHQTIYALQQDQRRASITWPRLL
jgi:hypothetical protein